jgi:hypothetical protein
MDKTGAVSKANARANLNSEVERPLGRQRAIGFDDLFEVLPLNVFHHNVVGWTVIADIMHRHDIGMRQVSNTACLVAEASKERRITRQAGAQDFDRDSAP